MTARTVTNDDTLGLVILLTIAAVVLVVTVAAVAWRVTGHGSLLDPSPPTTWHTGPGDNVEGHP